MKSGERFGPATHNNKSSPPLNAPPRPLSNACALTRPNPPLNSTPPSPKKKPSKNAGMDFYVVLDRPGYRVAKRRQRQARVGIQHRLTKEDAMKWFQQKFDGVVLNKSSY